MLVKLSFFFLLISSVFQGKTALTFKSVMVFCEYEIVKNKEISFGTIITLHRIKQHFPVDQNCYRIDIFSITPILYDGAFTNVKGVSHLLLENNTISEIHPRAFINVTIRESMSLKYNKLTEIRQGVFNNVEVPSLYLSSNSISKIHSQAFDNMPTLEALYLDNNMLRYIDSNWFRNTPKLRKLVLKHNLIDHVPGYAFKNLVSSKHSLIHIDLSYNIIRHVDVNAFKKPNFYAYLSLAKNQIPDLNDDWLKGVFVKKLDLSNNRLMCLIGNGLAGPSSTNLIDGNPWICTCLDKIKKKENEGVFGFIMAENVFRKCNDLVSL